MEQTTHYNLKKPGANDFVDVGVLNENAEIIDAALYAAAKADLSNVSVAALADKLGDSDFSAEDIGAVGTDTINQAGGVAGYDTFLNHTGDTAAHVQAGERAAWNAKGEPYAVQVSLTTSGWSGSGPYTKTVTASGITADMNPVADVVQSSDTAASKLMLEAWACVSRIETLAGQVKATCYEEKPGVNLTVLLVGCKEGSA